MKKNQHITMIVTLAFLIALEIILTRFLSITLPIVRIGFGFLPVAIAGILFGPLWAGIAYAVGDILGMLIWPAVGGYFPGFTATCFTVGVIYGLVLHNKDITWKRAALAASLVIFIGTICLNTLWVSILYGKAFWGLMPARLMEAAILLPVQILIIKLINDRILETGAIRRLLPRTNES